MTPQVNLMEAVTARVSPDMIGAIARDVGASPVETSATVRRSVPSLFAGMISGASTEAGASRLLGMATEANESGVLGKLGGFGAGEVKDLAMRGQRMVGPVLGERGGAVADAIARAGGGTRELASRVLAILAPIALAVVGKEAASRQLGPGGLSRLLRTQKAAVLEDPDLPRGLASTIGLGEISTGAETVTVTQTPEYRRPVPLVTPSSRKTPWGWIAAIAGALFVAGLLLWGGWGGMRQANVRATQVPMGDAPKVRTPDLPSLPPSPVPLPEVPTSETTTTGATIERPGWESYKFNFDFATTRFTDDGAATVDKLASAMTASPDARIRLVGHTDAVGDDEYNQKLAINRAAMVKQKLVDRGIDPTRIEISGPGAASPVADNSTYEGRAANRRVDVELMKK